MKIEDEELVPIALNGFSRPWKAFVQGVRARNHMPTFEKLWEAFIQEETRQEPLSMRIDEASGLNLIRKMTKGRSGRGKNEEIYSSNHSTKELSHVKCFKYHKKGHYASECLEKKKGKNKQQKKQFAGSAEAFNQCG